MCHNNNDNDRKNSSHSIVAGIIPFTYWVSKIVLLITKLILLRNQKDGLVFNGQLTFNSNATFEKKNQFEHRTRDRTGYLRSNHSAPVSATVIKN